MKYIALIATALLCLTQGVYGQVAVKSVKAVTLQEAVQFALEFNTTVKNSRLGIEQAKARNWEIVTMGLPQLSGSIDYNYYFKVPIVPAFSQFFSDTTSSTARVFGYQAANDTNIRNILFQSAVESKDSRISFVLPHSITTGIQLTQLVFDARYFFGIKATKDLMRASRLSVSMSEQDVRYNVIKAYYQAQAANEAKAYLNTTLKQVQKLLADTRSVYKEGLIEEMDVDRLELVEANLQSQISMQNRMAEVAISNLKFQMGMNLTDELILKDQLDELKKDLLLAGESGFDVTKRVEYDLLNTAIKLKGYDVAQKRSGYAPFLAAFLSYGWSAQTNQFNDIFTRETRVYPDGDVRRVSPWFSQGLAGFSLKIPIFDSGQKFAQVKQAKIEQQKSMNDLENFKNGAELQYQVAVANYNSALADEVNTAKAMQLSEKIFRKNQIKFKEGVGSSFELVQSEQDLTANQLKHIQSTLALLNAKAELDKAIGK